MLLLIAPRLKMMSRQGGTNMSKDRIKAEAESNHKQFHEMAEDLIDSLSNLINTLPLKGMKEEDCQHCCLMNRMNELASAINGTTVEDFLPNQ